LGTGPHWHRFMAYGGGTRFSRIRCSPDTQGWLLLRRERPSCGHFSQLFASTRDAGMGIAATGARPLSNMAGLPGGDRPAHGSRKTPDGRIPDISLRNRGLIPGRSGPGRPHGVLFSFIPTRGHGKGQRTAALTTDPAGGTTPIVQAMCLGDNSRLPHRRQFSGEWNGTNSATKKRRAGEPALRTRTRSLAGGRLY